MKDIKLKDKTFRLSISEKEILEKVKEVAERINSDYEGKNPLFLSVLNGAFMFTSDLMKEITLDCQISFVKLASYQGTMSTGSVHEVIGVNENLAGRDIIIVEDIVESGKTMVQMLDSLSNRNPASVKICALFHKPSKPARLPDIWFSRSGWHLPPPDWCSKDPIPALCIPPRHRRTLGQWQYT